MRPPARRKHLGEAIRPRAMRPRFSLAVSRAMVGSQSGERDLMDDRETRTPPADEDRTREAPEAELERICDLLGVETELVEHRRAIEQLLSQRDLALALSAARDLDAVMSLCMEAALRVSGLQCGGIYLVDERRGGLVMRHAKGLSDAFVEAVTYYPEESPSVQLVKAGLPVYRRHDRLGIPLDEVRRREGLKAIAVMPIKYRDKVIGAVNLASRSEDEVQPAARLALEGYIAQIGGAIARIQSEERLRERDAHFGLLTEFVSDVFWTVDMELCFTYLSLSVTRVSGHLPEDLLGHPAERIVAGESMKRVNQALAERLQRGSFADQDPLVIELELLAADGSAVPVETSASFIVDGDGFPVGVAGISRDIRERKQAERRQNEMQRQLHEAQKLEAIGTLASGLAHDFNNILVGIVGVASLMKKRLRGNAELLRQLAIIEDAGQRAFEITGRLQSFSRRSDLSLGIVDVRAAIRNVIALLEHSVDKRISIVDRSSPDPLSVLGNPGQIEQVVMNLAVNGCEAMPDGGELAFDTRSVRLTREERRTGIVLEPGEYVELSISDNGAGIPEAVRGRVFDPFFTTKEAGRGSGSGMGLASTYGIVAAHGGAIDFESAEAGGTAFRVWLKASAEPAPTTDRPRESIPEKGKGTILLVDDEPMVRQVVASILEESGYRVLHASDGREATEKYRERREVIDLVILDMTMPWMSGSECFRELKQTDPRVRVLLSSGHCMSEDKQRLLNEGVINFIQKPYTAPELTETVAAALHR